MSREPITFDNNVLEQVAGVGLAAGEVQEKGIKRLDVPS
jgi:hypothetical protein